MIVELSDATRQLFSLRTRTVPGARSGESWVRTADLGAIHRQCDGDDQPDDLIEAFRVQELATRSRWAGSDPTRPGLSDVSARDYVDPAAIRARFIRQRNDMPEAGDDLRVLQTAIWTGRFAPVDRRVALRRVMAALPLSVGRTEQDGHRPVVVRFAGGATASDLRDRP
ncbi:hypothetical protein ACSNN8_06550 [Actinoplanes sp. URMC 104]